MKRITFAIFLSVIFSIETANLSYAQQQSISIWVRKSGSYIDGGNPGKLNQITISQPSLSKKIRALRIYDAQYDKDMQYRGVYLSQVLDGYPKKAGVDTALLHFANGMIIPITTSKDLKNIFIALSYKKNKKWSYDFPQLEKIDDIYYRKDPNPTKFFGNKVVNLAEKKLNKGKINNFSPWNHCNSLIGIELVNENAYFNQFEISKDKEIIAGFEVFKARCQFCHGVKQVGASFGWDYADPLKISKKRGKKNLHFFVKYPKATAFKQGLQMPNQIDVTEKETDQLWKWIDLISSKSPNIYKLP
ncbi:MAG: hypothetical protein R3B45_15770 [Bdellovibrionota bacterium]